MAAKRKKPVCGDCAQNTGGATISCSSCNAYFHPKCAGISHAARKKITTWTCKACPAHSSQSLRIDRPKGTDEDTVQGKKYFCPECNRKCSYGTFSCIQCNNWFHPHCAEITIAERKKNDQWICKVCTHRATCTTDGTVQNISQPTLARNATVNTRSGVSDVPETDIVATLHDRITKLNKLIEAKENRIVALEEKVRRLEDGCNDLPDNISQVVITLGDETVNPQSSSSASRWSDDKEDSTPAGSDQRTEIKQQKMHTHDPRRIQPCIHFLQNRCRKDNCRFRHICPQFISGNCDNQLCNAPHKPICPKYSRGLCFNPSCSDIHPNKIVNRTLARLANQRSSKNLWGFHRDHRPPSPLAQDNTQWNQEPKTTVQYNRRSSKPTPLMEIDLGRSVTRINRFQPNAIAPQPPPMNGFHRTATIPGRQNMGPQQVTAGSTNLWESMHRTRQEAQPVHSFRPPTLLTLPKPKQQHLIPANRVPFPEIDQGGRQIRLETVV